MSRKNCLDDSFDDLHDMKRRESQLEAEFARAIAVCILKTHVTRSSAVIVNFDLPLAISGCLDYRL